MKRIAILGSTGSIGQSTLEVVRSLPRHFSVTALSTNSNTQALYRQIREFRPSWVCVNDEKAALGLEKKIKRSSTKVLTGKESLEYLVSRKEIDQVVVAISGIRALSPLLKAIDSGKAIALANKEALVAAGAIIMERAKKKKIDLIPVDSEQSAIWQCLAGEDRSKLKNIYLTASGGPFLATKKEDLNNVSVAQVLRHPRWKMGKKISVDSANLMNKGLEMLEAMYLFNLKPRRIKVLIHPEAIVHSLVEFVDGVMLAQLSITDMRVPIQYALSYPERLSSRLAGVDLPKLKKLNFEEPDFKRFPCLGLSYRVADMQGTAPCAFNAADEVAVEEFLKRNLAFLSIPGVISRVLDKHNNITDPDLDDIFEADAWARREAFRVIKSLR
jgi:1-deoxy-D-xylulose-5-phosphate reductoisomerase